MRVFLDTNVLISAFATRGLCADLLRMVLVEHDLITGPTVLEEFERILLKKFKVPAKKVREAVQFLNKYSSDTAPHPPLKIALNDLQDVAVLAEALGAKTEIFVTGDHEIIDLRECEGLLIRNPREFWNELKNH